MKNALKLLLLFGLSHLLTGCATPIPPMTQKGQPPSFATIQITNYNRVHVGDEPLSLNVYSDSPEELTQGFSLEKLKHHIETKLTENGIKMDPDGLFVNIEVKRYGTIGYAIKSRNASSGVGVPLLGVGLTLAESAASEMVVNKLTEDRKKRLANGALLTINVPEKDFSTTIDFKDNYPVSDSHDDVTVRFDELRLGQAVSEFIKK